MWKVRFAFVVGIVAFVFYLSWWLQAGLLGWQWAWAVLVLVLLFAVPQLLANWFFYVLARRQTAPLPADTRLAIDVYVTSCDEPVELVEASLVAAKAMRGAHRTWLLDDGRNPALARLARRLGVGYLARGTYEDAKAGNINAALKRTDGDLIVIFDVDHVPDRSFLEQTVGYFSDPAVGFVQVMLTFSNSSASWVAAGASETSIDWYNPTSLGMDAAGAVTMMGSNAVIRRAALDSIGGYQPGLAEDLATSLALHAAGWQSRYVAEPLAPGLAPPDLAAWFTQQLKWSRGVFEVLLCRYPRLIGRLRWSQRLGYALRQTRYLIGPVIFAHLAATILVLFAPAPGISALFESYLLFFISLVLADAAIRFCALQSGSHPAIERGLPLRAMALAYSTWPIYTRALAMALLRRPLDFRPTPKSASGNLKLTWLLPQVVTSILLAVGVGWWMAVHEATSRSILVALFALVQLMLHGIMLQQWILSVRGGATWGSLRLRLLRLTRQIFL